MQVTPAGRPCSAPPMRDERYCFWHHPDKTEEAAEARRLGGLRRRRERTLAGASEFDGFGSVESVERILDIATFDALGLENSIARSGVLIRAGQVAIKVLEVKDIETRLAVLEAGQEARRLADDETDAFQEDA